MTSSPFTSPSTPSRSLSPAPGPHIQNPPSAGFAHGGGGAGLGRAGPRTAAWSFASAGSLIGQRSSPDGWWLTSPDGQGPSTNRPGKSTMHGLSPPLDNQGA